MSSGSGRSLGAALVELFATAGRPGGSRSTYDRKGWRAQFSQMSRTKAGYAAMEAAGLSASIATQRAWLSGEVAASRANQGRIADAYRALQGGFNDPRWASANFAITGRVTQGRDSRERGRRGSSPLRLEGRLGRWDRIAQTFDEDAEPDPDVIEELFVKDVVIPNLGEGSDPWQFDGDWYEVSA